MSGRRGEDSTLRGHPVVGEQLDGLEQRLVEGISDSDRKKAICGACVQIRSQVLGAEALRATA
jgi:hypothetical protein